VSDDDDLDRWADNGGAAMPAKIVELPKVTSDEVIIEHMGKLAKHYRRIYDSYLGAGFTPEQSFDLLRDFIAGMAVHEEEL
jgi:hypothetical protein